MKIWSYSTPLWLRDHYLDLDRLGFNFLVHTNIVRQETPEQVKIRLIKAQGEQRRGWLPEAALIGRVLEKAWKKHALKHISQVAGAFTRKDNQWHVDEAKARKAISGLEGVGDAIWEDVEKQIGILIGLTAANSERYWKGKLGLLKKADITTDWSEWLAGGIKKQYEAFVKSHPERVVGPEIERLIQIASDNELSRKVHLTDFTERLERVAQQPSYWARLSDVEQSFQWNAEGILVGWQNGVTTYGLMNPMDDRTCKVCESLHGTEYTIEQGREYVIGRTGETDPDVLKENYPFPRFKDVDNISTEALQNKGYCCPPFHGNCRDEIVYLGADFEEGVRTVPVREEPSPLRKVPLPPSKILRPRVGEKVVEGAKRGQTRVEFTYKKFRSYKEAEAWAKLHLADNVNFGDATLEEINAALGHMRFLVDNGAIKAENRISHLVLERQVVGSNGTAYGGLYHWAVPKDKMHLFDDATEAGKIRLSLAQSIKRRGLLTKKELGNIREKIPKFQELLKRKDLSDSDRKILQTTLKKYREDLKKAIDARSRGLKNVSVASDVFDSPLGGTLVHEFGHALDDQLSNEFFRRFGFRSHVRHGLRGKEIDNYTKDFLKTFRVTDYSTENIAECLAENFSVYVLGEVRQMHPEMVRFFDDMFPTLNFGRRLDYKRVYEVGAKRWSPPKFSERTQKAMDDYHASWWGGQNKIRFQASPQPLSSPQIIGTFKNTEEEVLIRINELVEEMGNKWAAISKQLGKEGYTLNGMAVSASQVKNRAIKLASGKISLPAKPTPVQALAKDTEEAVATKLEELLEIYGKKWSQLSAALDSEGYTIGGKKLTANMVKSRVVKLEKAKAAAAKVAKPPSPPKKDLAERVEELVNQKGNKWTEISKQLNAEGYTNTAGNPLSPTSVKNSYLKKAKGAQPKSKPDKATPPKEATKVPQAKPDGAETMPSTAGQDFSKVDAEWDEFGKLENFPKTEHANLSGVHAKEIWIDSKGDRWLFKPVPEGREYLAHIEETAYKVGREINPDMVEVRTIRRSDGTFGSIQRMRADLQERISIKGFSPDTLTKLEIESLQREHVIDWLLLNMDTHCEQFLRLQNGRLLGIDKGQSYKFMMESYFDAPGVGTFQVGQKWSGWESVYPSFYGAGRDGVIKLDPAAIATWIDKVDALPEDKFLAALRPYAESLFKNDKATLQDFYDNALKHKRRLRGAFEETYSEILGREVKFGKGAAQRQAAGLTEAEAEIGIGKAEREIIEEARKAGWQGKSIPFDEEIIEDQNLLIVQEYMPDGKERTVLSMKVRQEANDGLIKRFDDMIAGGTKAAEPIVEEIAVFSDKEIFNELKKVEKWMNDGYAANESFAGKKIAQVYNMIHKAKKLPLTDENIKAIESYEKWIEKTGKALVKGKPAPKGLKQFGAVGKAVKTEPGLPDDTKIYNMIKSFVEKINDKVGKGDILAQEGDKLYLEIHQAINDVHKALPNMKAEGKKMLNYYEKWAGSLKNSAWEATEKIKGFGKYAGQGYDVPTIPAKLIANDDEIAEQITSAIKHINFHASDGAYKTEKLALLDGASDSLKYFAADNPHNEDIKKMVDYYESWIKEAKKAHKSQKVTSGYFVQYDGEGYGRAAQKAKELASGNVAGLDDGTRVSRGAIKMTQRESRDGKIFVVDDNKDLVDLIPSLDASDVRGQYDFVFPDGVKIRYRAWDTTDTPFAIQGQVEVFVDGAATPESVAKAVKRFEEIGLPSRVATEVDTELMYLQKHAAVSGADQTEGYKKLVAGFKNSGTSKEDQIVALRKYWSKRLKVADVTKLDDYQPFGVYQHSHAGLKTGAGKRIQYRFDISAKQLEEEMKDHVVVHSLYGRRTVDSMKTILTNNGSMVATTEKLRMGVPVGGMSPGEDMMTGGANYFFTRIKRAKTIKERTPYSLIFKRQSLRRLDAISYQGDMFGRTTGNFVAENRKNLNIKGMIAASKGGNNETIFKDTMTLVDNIEYFVVENKKEYDEIVKLFKERGYARLPDGRPIEEAVINKLA